MELILEKSKDIFYGTVKEDGDIIVESALDEEDLIEKMKTQVAVQLNIRKKNIIFEIKKKYK